jgi:hypothetical protein
MSIINDKELKEEVILDLINFRGYTKKEAEEWLSEYEEHLMSAMLNEYLYFIEEYAEYKGI